MLCNVGRPSLQGCLTIPPLEVSRKRPFYFLQRKWLRVNLSRSLSLGMSFFIQCSILGVWNVELVGLINETDYFVVNGF